MWVNIRNITNKPSKADIIIPKHSLSSIHPTERHNLYFVRILKVNIALLKASKLSQQISTSFNTLYGWFLLLLLSREFLYRVSYDRAIRTKIFPTNFKSITELYRCPLKLYCSLEFIVVVRVFLQFESIKWKPNTINKQRTENCS